MPSEDLVPSLEARARAALRLDAQEPLVGRAVDLAAIAAHLDADARVVTLTGAAGVGKTRLAMEAALRVALEGRADVWRVELGEARGVEGIEDAIGLALGLQREPSAGVDAAARIARAIAARGEALIVLDELDALVEHAPATIGKWTALAPEVSFLVTSRERLGIAGEIVHEVAPLGLPEGGADGQAVDLFVRAVRRVRSDYAVTAAEAPFVTAIVCELDGLPLAIELCAPRMALMGARALLHRLASRFDVLRTDRARAGSSGRHATLEAAIDASWIALAPWERDALAQASVFRGGFSLDAAEAVIDVSAHAGAPSVLDVVAALRDKSLLHAFPSRVAPGEIRIAAYASIREFAARRLAAAAAIAAEQRHAAHVVSVAESWSARASSREGPEMRARILAERDNLLAVIERVLGRGPVGARAAEPALRAICVLGWTLLHEGALEAHVRLLDPVLSATRDSGADPRLIAGALAVRGALLRRRGHGRAGSRDLVRALTTARTLGDRGLEARVVHELGHALASRGETAAARDHFEQALTLCRDAGDRGGTGSVLASLGALLAREGRLDEAEPLVERARALHAAEQDGVAEAADLRVLGEILLDQGRLDEARARLIEARDVAHAASDRRGEAVAAGLIGRVDHLAGDRDAARAAYEGAAASLRDLGFAPAEALFAGALGVLCREEGRTAEAFAWLASASDLLGDDADVRHAAILLAHRGALDAAVGRTADARAVFARADEKLAKARDLVTAAVLAIARAEMDGAAPRAEVRDLAHRSADVRLALRCFERASESRTRTAAAPSDDALVIGGAGRWFRPPYGARVGLDRRRPLALLLDRLASERADRPGAPLAWDTLLDAAWPGERVLATAGAHRVRVAVSTLRKLGLKDVLWTRDEGYLLAPDVSMVRVD